MKKKLLSNSILFILLVSCDHIYKEYDKESFSTLSWKRGKEIMFYPSIEDVSRTYELTLGIRHIYGAQIKRINISVKVIAPSGKESLKEYAFNVVNARGEYLANCAGDLCDLEVVVDSNLKFSETGKYQFVITHTEHGGIPGIMEFGMIID